MAQVDDSAIRKLRSFGYYEEGNDATRRKVITLRDYPIGVEVAAGRVSKAQESAAGEFFETWYRAGLGGGLKSTWGGGESYGDPSGYPASDTEAYHRQRYRDAIGQMGLLCGGIVEWVVCWRVHIPILARRWPGYRDAQQEACENHTRKMLISGLNRLLGAQAID